MDEAREEAMCTPSVQFDESFLYRFGAVGGFEVDAPGKSDRRNVESSTAYILTIPEGCDVSIREVVRGVKEYLKPDGYTLNEMIDLFNDQPESFADGAGRILKKMSQNPNLQREFRNLLKKIT